MRTFGSVQFGKMMVAAVLLGIAAFPVLAGLPAGYQAVDWIEARGGQSIDAGFSPPRNGGTAVDIEFAMTGGGNSRGSIFSCGYCDWNNYMLLSQNGTVAFGRGVTIVPYVENLRTRLNCDSAGNYSVYTNGALRISGTNAGLANNRYPNHLTFFECGGTFYAYCKLYSASFATNGIPVRDYVPCRRISDNKPGLFDRVENLFYINGKNGADFNYGADRLLADDLKVSGNPVNCGVPSVAYGLHGGYAAGQNVSISVMRVGENSDGTIRGTCTGYEVLTNGIVYLSGDVDENDGDTVQVSFPFPDCDRGAEVILKWDAQCRISSVSADASRGTVSKDYEWHSAGDDYSVEAIPNDGYCFYRWVGSDNEEYGRESSLTVTVADAITLTAEFGELRVLSPSGGDDTGMIAAAISELDAGSEIRLTAGTYNISATMLIDKDIRITGVDRDSVIVRGNGAQRLFKIDGESAPGASIENITMRNGYDAEGWGGGAGEGMTRSPGGGAVLLYKGGMVKNCIVEECSGRQNGGAYGIHAIGGKVIDTVIRNLSSANTIIWGQALIAEGGALISHCVISNCTALSQVQGADTAPVEAYGTGTELRNCLIAGCRSGHSGNASDNHGMAVYFRTAGAKLSSCTITDNTMTSAKGNAVVGSGTVVNCLVAGNLANVGASSGVEGNFAGAPSVTYSASRPLQAGTGNLLAPDILFSSGTFELTPGSALIGAGTVEGWMASSADLKGTDRLRGNEVDIGAFCYVPPALVCSISCAAEKKALESVDATVTSQVDGNLSGLVYTWIVNGADTSERGPSYNLKTSVAGLYTVALRVTNGNGDTATSEPVVFAVVPAVIYVDVSSADPVAPYGDRAHAAANLLDAVDAAISGCTILVSPGKYDLGKTLYVNERLDFRSIGNRDNTVIHVAGDYPGIYLNARGATFCGFTVTNGYMNRSLYIGTNARRGGGNLYAGEGTTVEDCRFSGGRCGGSDEVGGVSLGVYNATVRNCEIVCNNPNPNTSGWQLFHGVVKVSGPDSLVDRCLIADNSQVGAHRGQTFRRAAGLQLEGGTVRNCLFYGNFMTEGNNSNGTDYGRGSAVYAKGGILENCTVAANFSQDVSGMHCPAVQAEGAAVIRNCVIYGNKATSGGRPGSDAVADANWGGNDSQFSYCCTIPALSDEHSVSADPKFKLGGQDPYSLSGGSPCIGRGLNAPWMADALDFAGNRRRSGTVEIGCYEIRTGMRILIK